jgi:putative acetyltransferase
LTSAFTLRPYRASDEEAAITLWLTSWQEGYPAIDFAARLPWWRERWRSELVPNAAIIVAQQEHRLLGSPSTNRAISTSSWLRRIIGARSYDDASDEAAAFAVSITLLVNNDNARAIRFYERNGCVHRG